MPVRIISIFVVSGWLVCSPLTTGADRLPNTTNQKQVRQEALHLAKERKRARRLTFDMVKQSYQAKRRALAGLLAAAKSKQQKIAALATAARKRQEEINFTKARTLAETRLIAKILSRRQAAEEYSIALVISQLEQENPNFREQALRLAKQQAEQDEAEQVTDLMSLPVLNNSLPMTYHQDSSPSNNLVAKISPARPTNSNRDQQAVERAVKKRLALRKVADIARQVKSQQAAEASKSHLAHMQELIDLYKKDMISAAEYYRRKHLLDQGK
jgi:hypothetical protein